MTPPAALDQGSWNAAIEAAAGKICAYCDLGVPRGRGGVHAMWTWTGSAGESFRPNARRRIHGSPEYLPCAAVDILLLMLPSTGLAGGETDGE